MKKLLVIAICCYATTGSNAQTGELPPIDLHENLSLGTINGFTIAGAETIPGTRLICLSTSCLILPVELLSFEGKRINEGVVELKWVTENETNNAGFDVERSLGNTAHFEKIDFVAGRGNSSAKQNYKLDDPNTFSGKSYYRLKQIDFDGKFKYSKTIAVSGYSRALVIFPNPSTDKLNFSVELSESTTGVISICDMGGRVMIRQQVQLKKGTNVQQVAVERLTSGVYVFRLTLNEETAIAKTFAKK